MKMPEPHECRNAGQGIEKPKIVLGTLTPRIAKSSRKALCGLIFFVKFLSLGIAQYATICYNIPEYSSRRVRDEASDH